MVHSNTKTLSFSVSNNSKDSKSLSKSSSLVSTTKNDQATKEDSIDKTKTKEQAIVKDLQHEDCQNLNTSTKSIKSTKCSEIKEMPSSSKDREITNIENELENSVEADTKESSVDSKREGFEDVSREAQAAGRPKDQKTESTVLGKKRKLSDSSDIVIKKAKTKKQNSQDDSAKLESKSSSADSKETKNMDKTKLSSDKKRKSDDRDKKNSTLKQQLKQKPEPKIVDIDFFSSPKKVKPSKTESKEKTNNKKEPSKEERKAQNSSSQLKTLRKNSDSKHSVKRKLKQSDSKETKISRKSKVHDNVTKKSSVPLTTSLFESEDEIRFSSDSLSGSESDMDPVDSSTEMLREIFDNYDPQRHLPSTSSNTRKAKECATGSSRLPSTSSSPGKEKQQKAVELQGLVKKQRVAHTASYVSVI